MINVDELRGFVQTAQQLINSGAAEDVLRHLLSTKLSTIFEGSPRWIMEHANGTETHMHFTDEQGTVCSGFADAVVGKTAIEYEKNLTAPVIFRTGYRQVKEYCAGLYNKGIRAEDIHGILSDTVRWFGYTVTISGAPINGLYGINNVELHETDVIDLSLNTETEFIRFESFVNQHLNRTQMLSLSASSLVRDFGVDSGFYTQNISVFRNVVNRAMTDKPDYAELIKTVWQNFVAYLGAADYGVFSRETYTNELYLLTVAKIVCANILQKVPIICPQDEVIQILNGTFFTRLNIENLVDYDYFGWLNDSPYVESIAECAMNIQRQLTSYDFAAGAREDLFGELLAHLASKEHRLLLGQEFTPHWIAKEMAIHGINQLQPGTEPKIVDMCCGSGVFLIEAIQVVREKYEVTLDGYDEAKDKIMFSCVTGFDIDPLAVMLAKVNWVLAMRDLFELHHGAITIPVYHADSMFVATPITTQLQENENRNIELVIGDYTIELPSYLFSPEYRKLYDSFVSKCYRVAMQRAANPACELEDTFVSRLVEQALDESNTPVSLESRINLATKAKMLVTCLEQMQRAGRNGIWYFILSNSYRPGLCSHEFNCLLSNPPWLAMSKLSDNPYKEVLKNRAAQYGIQAPGSSHLHAELATTFLINAIEKFLAPDAVWCCVMPGSIMSGYNHEPIRKGRFRTGTRPVPMAFKEIWELPIDTFKNKAIVLYGNKGYQQENSPLSGRFYADTREYSPCTYRLICQESRTAWTNRTNVDDLATIDNPNPMTAHQGIDLFPKSALYHSFAQQRNGNWTFGPITRDSEEFYTISDIKQRVGLDLSAQDFDDTYVVNCIMSKNLSPFHVSQSARAIMPCKKVNGEWSCLTDQDVALMNPSTAFIFNRLQQFLNLNLQEYFEKYANCRGKLSSQNFSTGNWLVLSSASGSKPCAAYISTNEPNMSKVVIDQTLYWYLTETEDEAIYLTGLINSDALENRIFDFQPRGRFGRRHIHTWPFKVSPRFDPNNPEHIYVVEKTRALMAECVDLYQEDAYRNMLNPNNSVLHVKRPRQQAAIRLLPSYQSYDSACDLVLG